MELVVAAVLDHKVIIQPIHHGLDHIGHHIQTIQTGDVGVEMAVVEKFVLTSQIQSSDLIVL